MVAPSSNSGSPSARGGRGQRVGLSPFQERRLKANLRLTTCSEPWVEAQFKSADDVDERGSAIVYRYHDPHVYPPGGAKTQMRRCRECGLLMPPNALEGNRCMDHGRHTGWGPSPSAETIRALQMLNLRMADAPLPPEDTASLRKEIRQHQRAQKTARVMQVQRIQPLQP